MRHKEKVYAEGDTRQRESFLWLPKTLPTLDGKYEETRWLERAVYTQRFRPIFSKGSYGWADYEWVEYGTE